MDDDDQTGRDSADGTVPFSHETLALFQRVMRAKSKEERLPLLLALANQFAKEYDPSDPSATDDFHVYFEELAKAKLAYETASARVGRLATECIQQYLAASGTTIEEASSASLPTTKSLN